MKALGAVLLLCLAGASYLTAADKKVEAVMAEDADTEPTDVFGPDTPKLYAFFRSQGTTKGDKLRAVWIAEDVGGAADANTTIDEATLVADKDDFFGAFSLSKPDDGWPEGKYRVDIYLGDAVAISVKFKIEAGVKSSQEKSSDE